MNDVELSSDDVARHAGCTYRQLDWWTRLGAIAPSISDAGGSGNPRRWSRIDADAVAAITRVADDLAGLGADMPTELVARIWRTDHDDPTVFELRVGTVTFSLRREAP